MGECFDSEKNAIVFITPSSVIQKLTETDAIVKMLEIEKQ